MAATTDTSRGIARSVSAALRDAGIPQRDAADITGIPIATLSRRLTGVGKPFDVIELEQIAHMLGVKVSDLIARAGA